MSDTMRIINIFPYLEGREAKKIFKGEITKEQILVRDIDTLALLFRTAMQRGFLIFGEHAFRKSYEDKRKTPINKALFEVWSVLLSKLTDEEFIKLKANKEIFLNSYKVFLEDSSFSYVISRDSLKFTSVKDRYEKFSKLLGDFIK